MTINPIDVVSGVVLILAGVLMMSGFANIGVLIAGVGLIIQAIKVILQLGV